MFHGNKFIRLTACAVLFMATISRAEDAAPLKKIHIVLTGDSTVATGGGWGTGFIKLLGPDAKCTNLAKNGASTVSYRDLGLWAKALAEKPDYIFIQFGHNDSHVKGNGHVTEADSTFPENMGRFVDDARAIGAQPVLVTSVPRRNFKDGKIVCNLVPYVEATKKVAAEKKVPLLDLNARSIAMLDKLGVEAARELNAVGKDGKVGTDVTHFSEKGGFLTADWLALEVRAVHPELARYLKAKE